MKFIIFLVAHLLINSPSGQSLSHNEEISKDDVHTCSSSNLFDQAHYTFPQAIENATIAAGLPPQMKHIFGTFLGFQAWIPGIKMYETPLIVRFTHLIDRMGWNCVAAYSLDWKDYLIEGGEPLVRVPMKIISPDGIVEIDMHNSDLRYQCMIHAWSTVVQDWVPESAENVLDFISIYGLTDSSPSYDDEVSACFDNGKADAACLRNVAAFNCYKPSIVGAIVAQQLTEFARTDGWNMEGKLDRDGSLCTANCNRYTDPTGYEPDTNYKRDKKNKFIHWQPLTEINGRGYETKQQHVVPHIGKLGKPSTMTRKEMNSRVAPKPNYKYQAEARKVLKRMRKLNDEKKMLIEFFDDKIDLIVVMINTIAQQGVSFEQLINYVVGVTGAEYDSIILSWKEKVRHDLLRPTTWIQNNWGYKTMSTWVAFEKEVMEIKGKNFEAYVRVMPHSEYLSGSACLCHAVMEFTDDWLQNNLGMNSSVAVTLPEFPPGSSKVEPGMVPSETVSVVYPNMKKLRNACGNSRLHGGMHFGASVVNAYDLCKGVGNGAADKAKSLWGEL